MLVGVVEDVGDLSCVVVDIYGICVLGCCVCVLVGEEILEVECVECCVYWVI